jgi:hypothetical protein
MIGLIKWLIKDTWEDIKFLGYAAKRIKNRQPILDPEKKRALKDYMKSINPTQFIKDNWLLILCVIFAGIMGWFLGSQYTTTVCNRYIYDNYIVPNFYNSSINFLTNS